VIGLRIEARRRSDAACIAEAVDASLSRARRGWLVETEMDTSSDLERALTALQSCLDGHAIPVITVVVDDERYVMKATPEPPAKHATPYS
jgi:hypothetical protein